MNMLKKLWNDEAGQGMVEYGLIIALVAVVAIGALAAVGGQLDTLFTNIKTKLTPTGTTPPATGG
ncbi:MAG: Flp family type IVb pilin [Bacillota bacterium]